MIENEVINKIYKRSNKYKVILKGHIIICEDIHCILFAHYCKSTPFYKDFYRVFGDILKVHRISKKNIKEVKRLLKYYGCKKVWSKGVFSFYGDLRPLAVKAGFGHWSKTGLIENDKYGTDFLITAIFYK